jgi:hypothetical protein
VPLFVGVSRQHCSVIPPCWPSTLLYTPLARHYHHRSHSNLSATFIHTCICAGAAVPRRRKGHLAPRGDASLPSHAGADLPRPAVPTRQRIRPRPQRAAAQRSGIGELPHIPRVPPQCGHGASDLSAQQVSAGLCCGLFLSGCECLMGRASQSTRSGYIINIDCIPQIVCL